MRSATRSFRVLSSAIVLAVSSALVGCGGSGADDPMKYMPNGCQGIISVQLEQIINSPAYADVKKENPDVDKFNSKMEEETGLTSADISQFTVFVGDINKQEMVAVIRTKKDVKASELATKNKKEKYKEVKVGNFAVQEGEKESLCSVEPRLLIAGTNAALKAVLERNKKPDVPEALQQVLKDTDMKKSLAVAFTVNNDAKGMAKMIPVPAVGTAVDSIQGVAITAMADKDVNLNITVTCKDAKSADDNRKMLEGLLVLGKGKGKEIDDLVDAIKISAKDNKLIGSMVFVPATLMKTFGKSASATFNTVGGK